MIWFLILMMCEGVILTDCNPVVLPAPYVRQDDCIAAGKQAVETKGVKRFHCVAYRNER
jgi:hypothetical protein